MFEKYQEGGVAERLRGCPWGVEIETQTQSLLYCIIIIHFDTILIETRSEHNIICIIRRDY